MRDGWSEVELGDVVELNPDQVKPAERVGRLRYIDIAAVSETAGVNPTAIRDLDWADAPSRARRRTLAQDVLVSTVRPYLRAFGLIGDEEAGAVASTGFCLIRATPGVTDPGFIWGLVRTEPFVAHLVDRQTGSNYPAVRPADIGSYRFPLPPLAEQRRIAYLIGVTDEVHGAAERGAAAATSLLSHLTEDLLLNETWPRTGVGDIAELMLGFTKGRRTSSALRSVAYLRAANVQAGHLDLGDVKSIDATQAEIDRLALRSGDVLLLEGGNREDVGRGWIWEGQIPNTIHQNSVIRARCDPGRLIGRFLAYWITTSVARNWCFGEAKQTANIAHLSMGKAANLPVPLPSLAVQAGVVGTLDSVRMSRERGAAVALRAHLLRRAVLQALVSGDHEVPSSYDRFVVRDDEIRPEAAA